VTARVRHLDDSHIDEQMWMDVNAKYKAQQDTLERQISAHNASDRTYLQQGIQILELANRAYALYLQQPHEERVKLLQFLLSNAVLKDGNLCPTYRKPFDMLANGVSHQRRRTVKDSNPSPPGRGGPVRLLMTDVESCDVESVSACTHVQALDHIRITVALEADTL
jgi:hypothetical protein